MEGNRNRRFRYRVRAFLRSLLVLIERYPRSPEEVARIDRLAEEISIVQDLREFLPTNPQCHIACSRRPPSFCTHEGVASLRSNRHERSNNFDSCA